MSIILLSEFILLSIYNRCFLSAGSPAASPAKSRVVEAICIHLCEKISSPKRVTVEGRRTHTSRWDMILSEYSKIKARVLNSLPLLEGTTITLYPINKVSLLSTVNMYFVLHMLFFAKLNPRVSF